MIGVWPALHKLASRSWYVCFALCLTLLPATGVMAAGGNGDIGTQRAPSNLPPLTGPISPSSMIQPPPVSTLGNSPPVGSGRFPPVAPAATAAPDLPRPPVATPGPAVQSKPQPLISAPAVVDFGRRVALVVGNAAYAKQAALKNSTNDARLMARTLQSLGFILIGGGPQLDLNKAQFDRAVRQFGQEISDAEVALFYFSGHGMQDRDVNWLVPTDGSSVFSHEMPFVHVSAELIKQQMEASGAKLNLLILDSCRGPAFAAKGMRGPPAGFVPMKSAEGTLIAYATQPGALASDGDRSNSPYTEALADEIIKRGVDIFNMFNRVGLRVRNVTRGSQVPWVSNSPIDGTFYLAGPN